MSLLEQKELTENNLFKLLKKSVKKIVLENGIDPNTKKGNKELDFLLKKIAKFNYLNLEQVQEQGEKIGNLIVELSKERDKTHLDQGIIKHILLKEAIPLVGEAPTAKASVASKTKTTSVITVVPPKATTPVIEKPAKKEEIIPTPVIEETIEDEAVVPSDEIEEIEEEEVIPTAVAEVEEDDEVDDDDEDEDEEEEINPPVETIAVEAEEVIPTAVAEAEEDDEVDDDEEEEEINPPVETIAVEEEVIPTAVAEAEEDDEVDEDDEDEDEEEEINPPIETVAVEAEEVIPTTVAEDDEDDEVDEDDEDDEEEINPPVETVAVEAEEVIPTTVAEVEEDDEVDEDEEEEEPVKAVETTTPASKDIASMSLKDRIGEDIKTAMKAQDKVRLETVRGIKKVILEKEIAVRPDGQKSLTPEQEIEVLSQQAKQRRDSIEQFTKAERDDLAEKEAQELAIIETYLPKQLADEELTATINEIIASVGATSVKDLGKVMGVAMKQLKGKADGKKIQDIVKNQLS